MSGAPAPDLDTAMVLGMASTALPFADSPEAEAERWLRILRMYGDAGSVLQALGVSEAPLESPDAPAGHDAGAADAPHNDVIRVVTERAVRVAAERRAQTVGAGDVLVAVMAVYGQDFDRVLRVHGTDRDEVLERLGVELGGDAGASGASGPTGGS
jgi:hypothetical protein